MNIKLLELFEIHHPKTMIFVEELENPNGTYFISSKGTNNGIVGRIERNENRQIYKGGAITVPLKGSVLEAFYQEEEFQVAHQVAVLYPKRKMLAVELIYYTLIIRQNKYKYNYGRQADKTLKDILVPEKIPDGWKYLDIKKFEPNKNPVINKKFEIDSSNWKKFSLEDLFEITGSKTTPLLELEEYGNGKYPFVTTQATNNGVEGFYDYHTEKGNVLVVDSAVIGYCSYQPFDFSASDHVEKLMPKFEMDKYIGLFLTTVLNKEQYRYNYGRKASQSRLKQRSIKLPLKKDDPDWEFMSNYIKSLPYSANL